MAIIEQVKSEVEEAVLDQVRFLNYVLEECRKRNRGLQEILGASYGKYVGIGAPYEEAICCLRKVKTELDGYLKTIRAESFSRVRGG